ncbi:hypothetical protein JGU66_18675 [Myxococcaceae bacterium JPH2]|nr:hypothetical protein [Myxococcaceae bacterium JPH2]
MKRVVTWCLCVVRPPPRPGLVPLDGWALTPPGPELPPIRDAGHGRRVLGGYRPERSSLGGIGAPPQGGTGVTPSRVLGGTVSTVLR